MNADRFASAERVADAVMYEGYILYPYRASAIKNKFRWQFGLIAPREYAEQTAGESWFAQTECLLEGGQEARLTVRMRCLQLQQCDDSDWDTAIVQVPVHLDCSIGDLLDRESITTFAIAGAAEITGVVRALGERRGDAVKLRIRIENLSRWPFAAASGVPHGRGDMLRYTLIGAHSLLHLDGGSFLSLLDPPPHAIDETRSCRNEHTWPVLAGPPGSRDTMLSLPIILYDHPAIAPESSGDFFDATEIDELLALRVLTLTDAEKREAASTDERARRIIERTCDQTAADLAKLHGAVRSFGQQQSDLTAWEEMLNPPGDLPPEEAAIEVGTVRLSRGARVRLAPQGHADPMDMFLAGRIATIAAVYRDLDDRAYVAVTVDDDPGADLRRSYGRFFYFRSSEIVPVNAEGGLDER